MTENPSSSASLSVATGYSYWSTPTSGSPALGEAGHRGNDAPLVAVVEVFKQQLLGQSPRDIAAIWHRLARLQGGRIAHTALSVIEQALWDILGQRLYVPIHSFFGGALRGCLRLYANHNRHVSDRAPDGFARAARRAVEEGFTAITFAPFDELSEPDHVRAALRAAWRPGVARVEAVRAASATRWTSRRTVTAAWRPPRLSSVEGFRAFSPGRSYT